MHVHVLCRMVRIYTNYSNRQVEKKAGNCRPILLPTEVIKLTCSVHADGKSIANISPIFHQDLQSTSNLQDEELSKLLYTFNNVCKTRI